MFGFKLEKMFCAYHMTTTEPIKTLIKNGVLPTTQQKHICYIEDMACL